MRKRKARRSDGGIAVLLHALDEGYDRRAWHGTALKGSLRGVTARQAAWRPAPGRHNIREVAVHAAYWKYRVRRRLTGEKRGSFPMDGTNWFELSGADEKAWRSERALLEREHRALRQAVAELPPGRLGGRLPGTRRRTALREIAGIALHDVYHAGQIQLLKALTKNQRTR
jgi:uncharacterized damage-inducible protein DinB